MGHETVVYGGIVGQQWKRQDYTRLQRLNEEVLASLPEKDEWPPLARSMFALPGHDVLQGTWKSQLMYFGGTFKNMEWEWDQWLVKFEQFLTRLFWQEVYLHLRADLTVGDYDYYYNAVDWLEHFYEHEPPTPATTWTLSGGPRKFMLKGDPADIHVSDEYEWLFSNGVWTRSNA